MRFADPQLLAFLGLIPLLLFLHLRSNRRGAAASYSDLRIVNAVRPTWRLRYRWLPGLAGAVAMALLLLALARPQTGLANSELAGKGIDIALVLDISGSMEAERLGNETRLAVAQRVLIDFIESRKEDRLALVVFRGSSLALSPLTLDYEALQGLVEQVKLVNVGEGTAIGVGLAESLNLLRDSRARSRVAVLLTDGENTAGEVQPLAAARIAESLGIRVYTIGILDSGSRSRGQANVDERALQEMARITGGRYFPAESPEALDQVYADIDRLEKSRIGRPQFAAYRELAPYFIAAGLLVLSLELALSVTIWRHA